MSEPGSHPSTPGYRKRPGDGANPTPRGLPASPECPFCDGRDTELVSPFGGQMSVAQCWCRSCRTAFDWLKWEG
jgi:hypothetical protein